MTNDINLRVTPEIASDIDRLTKLAAKEAAVDPRDICGARITRRSIDARQRKVMVNITLRIYIGEPVAALPYEPIHYPSVKDARQVVVVGAGPAGLFAALRLIELGLRPVVLERGKDVDARRKDLARIARENVVDPDSNYCFGEGGAGAYSDGKLYTRSKKRGSVDKILKIFHSHGADESILVDAHPHIGSDRLPAVIKAMRQTIISSGGEVRFETKVDDLILDGDRVKGIVTEDGSTVEGPVILATGHSARDIYHMLSRRGADLSPKGIAVGVRLEHPQKLIDSIQYHSPQGRGRYLPAAEYSMLTRVRDRAVYSFCMCPGGIIIPAASAPDELVVNGMSPSNRGSRWANSGMVVEVLPEDIPDDGSGVLKMMSFQESVEKAFYNEAGKSQNAPAQRMKDFVEGRPSASLPPTSYAPGIHTARIDRLLPEFIASRLRDGFAEFGRKSHGFLTNEAVLIGCETRTSSPVRITRDNTTLQHTAFAGLFPAGEGAGYAGGIVSAAIDGERCADAVSEYIHSLTSESM